MKYSLTSFLQTIPDFRRAEGIRYPLAKILMLIIMSNVALISEGDNPNVVLKCNDLFMYNNSGLRIMEYTTLGEPGFLGQQGFCAIGEPAANSFMTSSDAIPDLFFDTNTLDLVYNDPWAEDFSVVGASTCQCSDDNCIEDLVNFDYCLSLGYDAIIPIGLLTDIPNLDREIAQKIRALIKEEQYEEAYLLLQQYVTKMTRRRLAIEKIKKAQYNDAEVIITELPNEKEEDYYYKLFHNLYLSLVKNGKTIFDIDTSQTALLTEIAQSRTKTSFKAQAWLYIVKGIEMPVMLPTTNMQTSFKMGDNSANLYRFSPNPAANTTQMLLNLNTTQKAQLSLYNITGVLLKTIEVENTSVCNLDVSNYTNGLYLYQVKVNEEIVNKGKLTIIK